MLKKKLAIASAVGVVAIGIVGGTAMFASASVSVPTGSDAAVYVYDAANETTFPANHVFAYDDTVVGSASATDPSAIFSCPADATGVRTFLAPKGSEKTISSWAAWSDGGFIPSTKNVTEFAFDPAEQINGIPGQAAVKASGGDYSIGLACLKSNGVQFASSGLWFASVHITAGTGTFTVDIPTGSGPVTPPSGTADVNLTATTIAAADGVLSLRSTPAAATIGAPTLVNNLSTSTGQLGTFTVSDGRVISHPGWNLTSSVTDFSGAVTIPKAQLGVAPTLVSSSAQGVTTAAETLAGSAVYPAPFASATNAAQVGDSVFNANLTFVAPATAPAGTYTSKLTLTLTSN